MANGDRRKLACSGSVVPADANPTDVPNCTFTCLANETVECWGHYMVQKTIGIQDWTAASGRFYFQARRDGTGTPALTSLGIADASGSALAGEFTLTSDAAGVVKVQFTKQDYRGAIWLEGLGVVQSQS